MLQTTPKEIQTSVPSTTNTLSAPRIRWWRKPLNKIPKLTNPITCKVPPQNHNQRESVFYSSHKPKQGLVSGRWIQHLRGWQANCREVLSSTYRQQTLVQILPQRTQWHVYIPVWEPKRFTKLFVCDWMINCFHRQLQNFKHPTLKMVQSSELFTWWSTVPDNQSRLSRKTSRRPIWGSEIPNIHMKTPCELQEIPDTDKDMLQSIRFRTQSQTAQSTSHLTSIRAPSTPTFQ